MTLIAAPTFISSQGNPVSGPILSAGNVFYLDDSVTTKADATFNFSNVTPAGSPLAPFATGAFALTQCAANHQDMIVVGKAHSESIATLFALNTKANVTFIHLGLGISWMTEGVGTYRSPGQSQTIKRVAALLPATTTLNIFTIVGTVKVTDMYGIVEVVFPNTACTIRFGAVSTGLTEVFLSAASASMALAAVGTVVSIDGTVANAAILSVNQARIAQATAQVVHTGVIRITTSGSPVTGTVAWYMRYEPLAPGSYVIAA